MAKRKELWGYTNVGAHRIEIYKKWAMDRGTEGITCKGKRGIWIDVNAWVFDDPSRLDECLIHEFIHVIEWLHGPQNLLFSHTADCSQGARLLGHGLAQMLREMRQVGAED